MLSRWLFYLGLTLNLVSLGFCVYSTTCAGPKIADIDQEYLSLDDSLNQMTASLNRSEARYDLSRLLHWVAMNTPEQQSGMAKKEASYLLQGALRRSYAAAHDISVSDLVRTEADEMLSNYSVAQRLREVTDSVARAKDQKEKIRLSKELEALEHAQHETAKTVLGKKFQDLAKTASAEIEAADESDLMLEIAPTMKAIQTDFVSNCEIKQARKKVLMEERKELSVRTAHLTQMSLFSHILGLFLLILSQMLPTPVTFGARQE
jgi:hypothetical protein